MLKNAEPGGFQVEKVRRSLRQTDAVFSYIVKFFNTGDYGTVRGGIRATGELNRATCCYGDKVRIRFYTNPEHL